MRLDEGKILANLSKRISKAWGEETKVVVHRRYTRESVDLYADIFTVWIGRFNISFDIHKLHGCCGVAVFHDFAEGEDEVDEDTLLAMIEFMENIARLRHYTVAMFTDVEDSPWYSALIRAKYSRTDFVNENTDNVVGIFTKDLSEQ